MQVRRGSESGLVERIEYTNVSFWIVYGAVYATVLHLQWTRHCENGIMKFT